MPLCFWNSADDQVRLLAQRRPATQQQLAQLIGQQKAEVYGPQLLAALQRQEAGGARREPGAAQGKAQQQQQQHQEQPVKQAMQAKPQPRSKAKTATAKAEQQAASSRPVQQQRQRQGTAKPGPTKVPPEVMVLDSSGGEDSDFEAPAAKRGRNA